MYGVTHFDEDRLFLRVVLRTTLKNNKPGFEHIVLSPSQMICGKGVEGALPPLGDAVPKPLLVFLMTDLGLLYVAIV
jgi:hypothetical protein